MAIYPYIIFKGGIILSDSPQPNLSKSFGNLIGDVEAISEISELLNMDLTIFLRTAFDYEGEIVHLQQLEAASLTVSQEIEELIDSYTQEWEKNKEKHEAAWFGVSSFRETIQNLRYAIIDLEPDDTSHHLLTEIDEYLVEKASPCFVDELAEIERFVTKGICEGAEFCSFALE